MYQKSRFFFPKRKPGNLSEGIVMPKKTVGHIRKLAVSLKNPVEYQIPVGDNKLDLTKQVGKKIKLDFTGDISCIHCGRKIKKSYQQGYCFPCTQRLAECDTCLIKPELCHYQEGTCREPEWGETHCLQDHFVYLSNTSGVKVGITRQTNIPARWIDQGANQALPILRVSDRLLSGKAEVILKAHVADKTDWRKMLRGRAEPIDLIERKEQLFEECRAELEACVVDYKSPDEREPSIEFLDEKIIEIEYPVQQYPEKVKSLNFDKQDQIHSTLLGIKGQYLILEEGVLNIRKFAGYELAVTL
jgi:hypothetical protein